MTYAAEEEVEPKNLYAYSALLMDKNTGRVLWEKDGYNKRAMASTTKIMTAIVALENAELDEIVKVSERASRAPEVKLYIKPNEEYILEDMLHTLMLISSNDVAIAIAEHVSGSVEEFCKLMTKKAKQLGALNTSFKTPNGLDADGHYTTAYDLALITRYALNNETFFNIINTPSYSFSEKTTGRSFSIYNKNSFLNMYSGANGVKTGFTSKAGYCFVGSVKQGDLELIAVVLASGWPYNKTYRWADTKKLMDYGFKNFKTNKILDKDKFVSQIEIKNGKEKQIGVITSDEIFLTHSKSEKIDIIYNIEPYLEAPITIGQKVGEAEVYVNGQFYSSVDLLSDNEIERIDYKFIFDRVLDLFLLFTED